MNAEEALKNSGLDRVHFIAKYYSLESAAWYWATTNVKNTYAGSLNGYVVDNENSKGIFLITQYYINGFKSGINADLQKIREGNIDYEIGEEKLFVNGHSYDLPNNWSDREAKYEEACKIFG